MNFANSIANSGERTRPRVLVFGAPAETLELLFYMLPEEKIRDGDGAIANTRGRVRS
jgi:hypothetical protein